MKKIILLFVFLTVGLVIINAQQKTAFYGNSKTILKNPYGKGFIAGTNEYGDLGKYQRFDYAGKIELSELNFYFGYKRVVSTPDSVFLVVRKVNNDGSPGIIIYKHNTTMDKIDTSKTGTKIKLSTPLQCDNKIFVGFELPKSINDTLAIFTDKDGEGDKANRSWEQFSDGAFNDFGTLLFPSYSWGIDVDLWISTTYTDKSDYDTKFYGNSKLVLKNPYGKGFIAGTNEYGDLGKYQRFDLTEDIDLREIEYFFGFKKVVGTADTVSLVIRKVQTDGKPGDVIKSVNITSDKIDTTGIGTKIKFESALSCPKQFFAGFEFKKNNNDTLAIISDKNGEGDKANRVWEQFSDGQFNDFGIVLNPSYSWDLDIDLWIKIFYTKQGTVDVAEENNIPEIFNLSQNYPNPFNPSTIIKYSIPEAGNVTLKVYDTLGKEICTLVNEMQQTGKYSADFNTGKLNLSSGVYFYRLTHNNKSMSMKMLLVK